MIFLLLNYIHITLLLYLIYSILIIYLIKSMNKKSTCKLTLSDDQYFAINNSYDVKALFYFITYKLYHNRVILLDSSNCSFYLNQNTNTCLNQIESEVSKLYKESFSPKDFNLQMIDEIIFKNYFTSIYNSLESEGFLKSKKDQLFSKIIFSIGLFLILLPGIVILIFLYCKGVYLPKLIIGIAINVSLFIISLKDSIINELTPNGVIANEAYKKNISLTTSSFRNDTYANDMDKFLLQNCYMYYYLEDSNDDENSSDYEDD